jgi:hypothetical protein
MAHKSWEGGWSRLTSNTRLFLKTMAPTATTGWVGYPFFSGALLFFKSSSPPNLTISKQV